jgi:hypothetical protein
MPEPLMTFPVMAGAGPAPREDQIKGIVARVWADSVVDHSEVEPLLREWLEVEHCEVADEEFASLLAKARNDFDDVAAASTPGAEPRCTVHDLVKRLYWDIQALASRSEARRAARHA